MGSDLIEIAGGFVSQYQRRFPYQCPSYGDPLPLPTGQFCFVSSRRRHTRCLSDWSSDVCSSDLQRAVEYHPTLTRVDRPDRVTHLVLDLDPPDVESFSMAVRAAHLVRAALAEVGLEGAVKTSGAKGVHVFVPVAGGAPAHEAGAATRALAARAERLDPTLATTAFMKGDRG